MISQELKDKADQARREGFIVLGVHEGPLRLGLIVQLVQDIFPNHTLDQLAITEAEDGEFVVAAQNGIETKSN